MVKLLEKIEALSVRVDALSTTTPEPQGTSSPRSPLPQATSSPPTVVSAHPIDSNSDPRGKCRQIIQTARKEARQELKVTNFSTFLGGEQKDEAILLDISANPASGRGKISQSPSTIRGHLSAFDRLLTTSAIPPGSVCSYFRLLYSLSENVKNRISATTDYSLSEFSNEHSLYRRFETLYNDLRATLLSTYLDVSEGARLRQEWHDLSQKDGSSYLTFLISLDRLRVELRLQGDILADSAV
ncbi:hypothetical protein Pmar_PMAR027204, partial [Perkinsus marinus ATCC 50983]